MSGVTHRIEEAVKALEKGQVKKALTLTDSKKTLRHHQIVSDAARQCLSDQVECSNYLKDAAQKLKDTITAPLDTTDLEGVEEMLERKPIRQKPQNDEENCEECHVADAIVKFHEISSNCGNVALTQRIEEMSDDKTMPPTKWLKEMIEITEQARCGRDDYQIVLGELTDYLQGRDSPILRKLDES